MAAERRFFMKKIIAINASPHKDGDVAFLLKTALSKLLEKGFDTELIYLQSALDSAKTPFCVCCSSPCSKVCYKGTALEEVLNKMEDADGIIFGTPVYFGAMTAQLKCLFDKTRDARSRRAFVGKTGCVFTSGASLFGGQEATVRSVQDAMLVDGFTIIGTSSEKLGAGHMGVCSVRPAREDKNALSRIDLICERFAEEVK